MQEEQKKKAIYENGLSDAVLFDQTCSHMNLITGIAFIDFILSASFLCLLGNLCFCLVKG